jgi:hypothetical protein
MNAEMFQKIFDVAQGDIVLIIERNIWSIGHDMSGWFFEGKDDYGTQYLAHEPLKKNWTSALPRKGLTQDQAQKIFDIIEGDATIIYQGNIYSIGKATAGTGWGFFGNGFGTYLNKNWVEVPTVADYFVPGSTFQGGGKWDYGYEDDYYDDLYGRKPKSNFGGFTHPAGSLAKVTKPTAPPEPKIRVEDISPNYDRFLVDFEEVDTMAEKLGCLRKGYYSLFLRGANGLVTEAWGMYSTVANLDTEIFSIKVDKSIPMPA